MIERPGVVGHLVQRGAPIAPSERERETGAGRGERPEAERLEHASRARVPRVRDHEGLTLVERFERGCLGCLTVDRRHTWSLSVSCGDPHG